MSAAADPPQFDVLIVGGGPVGGCAGALLLHAQGAGAPLRVAILEPAPPPALPAAPAEPDVRVSAFSRASERIFASAGAWQSIKPYACAYERMRVWHASTPPDSADVLVFDAADAGEPNLGYIIENRPVTQALLGAFQARGGSLIAAGFEAARISGSHVEVATTAGTLTTRLLVGADGARSAVRAGLGIGASCSSYAQIAIVATVATERAHQWTAWQRFLGQGTLAFLPLRDGTSSIVWSLDEPQAQGLLAVPAPQFEAQLQRQSDGALGMLRLKSERLSFALTRLEARAYTAERCALIGDAAHVVHPLAGQGVNLGLLDAAALAELVLAAHGAGEDAGARRTLRAYERWRKSENEVMARAIDGFNRYLAHGTGPLSLLARRALALTNRSDLLKRFFIARAMGIHGELPRAARAS